MIEQGEYWTLSNGEKYIVSSIVKVDNNEYVYLLNTNNYQDFLIAEYQGDSIEEVEDPDLLENLISKFNEDLKENLGNIIDENI